MLSTQHSMRSRGCVAPCSRRSWQNASSRSIRLRCTPFIGCCRQAVADLLARPLAVVLLVGVRSVRINSERFLGAPCAECPDEDRVDAEDCVLSGDQLVWDCVLEHGDLIALSCRGPFADRPDLNEDADGLFGAADVRNAVSDFSSVHFTKTVVVARELQILYQSFAQLAGARDSNARIVVWVFLCVTRYHVPADRALDAADGIDDAPAVQDLTFAEPDYP